MTLPPAIFSQQQQQARHEADLQRMEVLEPRRPTRGLVLCLPQRPQLGFSARRQIAATGVRRTTELTVDAATLVTGPMSLASRPSPTHPSGTAQHTAASSTSTHVANCLGASLRWDPSFPSAAGTSGIAAQACRRMNAQCESRCSLAPTTLCATNGVCIAVSPPRAYQTL